ncbi:MAG TPA: M13 family metallopeptidase [Steroidobacteraceae bacterium]|nr:M13 family metallopeptidase [Steroidobacteraceae bacterium]
MKKLLAGALGAGLVTLAFAMVRPVFPPWGVTLTYMDANVQPGMDFFRYTNGSWLKDAVIPPDRVAAGINLELDKGNEQKLRTIIRSLAAKPAGALSAEERKLLDFYNTFEDTAAIERAGLAPVQGDLEQIAALKSLADVAAFMAAPETRTSGPVRTVIDIDEKNPDTYMVRLSQSGLGMPDRDYYLLDEKSLVETREAYKKYLADMLAVAGINDPGRAAAIYALEAKIAEAHWPKAETRDADKTYNPMSLSELTRFAPQFPWSAYFAAAGVSAQTPKGERTVVVAEQSAFPKLAAIFAETPVPVWRDYLTVHYLHTRADYLPKKVDDLDFAFYGTVIDGQRQQLPRDIRGVQLLDQEMGEALGKLYCARYFPPQAKAKIQQLVANLLKAYEGDIQSLSWMTPATRAKALDKIRAFYPKLGYPDSWRDYSALAISRQDLVGNVRNAKAFEWHRRLSRLDERVDRGEWFMTPPTNNAYYNPTLNEIVFPAGILQPPYFDPNADEAVNYGAIGAVIGHEISHGFDDQGSKYDAGGRLNNWWTDADRQEFDARTARLAQQYDQYEPLPGLHVNGKLTLGENIADLAGIVIAYKAYRIALGDKPAPVLNGFSGDQRFYIAYGQSWREVWTDGLTRRLVLSNPHSPSIYRVNGVVRNDNAWYAAFPQVKSGDTYYLPPDERVVLW